MYGSRCRGGLTGRRQGSREDVCGDGPAKAGGSKNGKVDARRAGGVGGKGRKLTGGETRVIGSGGRGVGEDGREGGQKKKEQGRGEHDRRGNGRERAERVVRERRTICQ